MASPRGRPARGSPPDADRTGAKRVHARPSALVRETANMDLTQRQTTAVPAIEGWFTTDTEAPHLLGTRCATLQHGVLPAGRRFCRNPRCRGREFETDRAVPDRDRVVLHRRPVPAAAALRRRRATRTSRSPWPRSSSSAERMVVLGQVAAGYGVDDLSVGAPVELVVEPLYEIDGVQHLTWRWRPAGAEGRRHDRCDRREGLSERARAAEGCDHGQLLSGSACTTGASGGDRSRSTASRPRCAPSTTPGSTGPTCSSSPAARRCATATPATWPAPPWPRRSAGPAPASTSLRRLRLGRGRARRRPHPHPGRALRRRARGRGRHHAQGLPCPQRRRALGRHRLAAVPAARA